MQKPLLSRDVNRNGQNVMDCAEAHGWALAWLKRHERKPRLLLRVVKAPITAR